MVKQDEARERISGLAAFWQASLAFLQHHQAADKWSAFQSLGKCGVIAPEQPTLTQGERK